MKKGSFINKIITFNVCHDTRADTPKYSMFLLTNRVECILNQIDDAMNKRTVVCLQEVSDESFDNFSQFFKDREFDICVNKSHSGPNRYMLTAAHSSYKMTRNNDLVKIRSVRKCFFCVNVCGINVINTHLPMKDNQRNKIFKHISTYVSDLDSSCIVAGDMNTFPNQHGITQVYDFQSMSGMYEATSVIFSNDDEEDHQQLVTFAPYPYDNDIPVNIPKYHLDHIFVKGRNIRVETPRCMDNVFEIEYENRVYSISDHFMIWMNFEIN